MKQFFVKGLMILVMGILGLNSSRGQLANSNQQFAIKEIKGQTFSYQPSIQRRLSGVKTIKILVPQRTMTDIDTMWICRAICWWPILKTAANCRRKPVKNSSKMFMSKPMSILAIS